MTPFTTTRLVLVLHLAWLSVALTGCNRTAESGGNGGEIQLQHAESYDKPIVHWPPEGSTNLILWENPAIKAGVRPTYPSWAKSRLPFSILLRLHVDEKGVTRKVEIIDKELGELTPEAGEKFVRQTMSSADKYEFEPLVQDGKAHPYITVIGVNCLPK